jgi:hypothetical protein
MKSIQLRKGMYRGKSLQMIREIMPGWRHCIHIQRELFIQERRKVRYGIRQRKRTV